MATRSDQDMDDDFSDIYKEYTGPLGSAVNNASDKGKDNKRSLVDSDEEDQRHDPNAVPTDFTSREAKFWEAKSKATERNWKKRKEEEMICKICGESGHFTQGCPSTLGTNRKSQDFFERVPAREKHIKTLFTEKVMEGIENDIGCKIKMEEKFIIVSGKDRLILKKGVDAVHKVIKGESNPKGSSGSLKSRSVSLERSPATSRLRHSETQRSYPSQPRDTPHFQQNFGGRRDKMMEDRIREDPQNFSKGSPQAYSHDGARSRSSHSKSPGRPLYAGNSYGSYDGHNHGVGGNRNSGWDVGRPNTDLQSSYQSKFSSAPQTLEELELEYKREAMELVRIRDKEEDEENHKHRETIREMRENYMKKLDAVRSSHKRQWDEFLQLDFQRRQQQAQQQMLVPGFSGYKQHAYSDYNGSSDNPQYPGPNLSMDPRARYPQHVESYHSRPHDTYAEFQHKRREDFGKAYNRH